MAYNNLPMGFNTPQEGAGFIMSAKVRGACGAEKAMVLSALCVPLSHRSNTC